MMIFVPGGLGVSVALLPVLVSCKDYTQPFVYHIYSKSFVLKGSYAIVVTTFCAFGLFKMKYWIKQHRIRLPETRQPSMIRPINEADPSPCSRDTTINVSPQNDDQEDDEENNCNFRKQRISYKIICYGIGGLLYTISESAKFLYWHIQPEQGYLNTFFGIFGTSLDVLYLVATTAVIAFFAKFKDVTV